jgi:hypothetical protein
MYDTEQELAAADTLVRLQVTLLNDPPAPTLHVTTPRGAWVDPALVSVTVALRVMLFPITTQFGLIKMLVLVPLAVAASTIEPTEA